VRFNSRAARNNMNTLQGLAVPMDRSIYSIVISTGQVF
jgi:hypothetical protein